MTIEILLNTPKRHEYKQKLSEFLVAGSGRIFLVTGFFSRYGVGAAPDLLSLLEWAAAKKERHLDVMVGIFSDGSTFQTELVVKDIVAQILAAQRLFKSLNKTEKMDIPVHFYGVKKWHAKAVGLTGLGKEFLKAEKIMFGSTNFSQAAMLGDNYEADVYADTSSDHGKKLVSEYVLKLRSLISEGIKMHGISDFHQQVLDELGDAVKITDSGFAFI